MLIDHATCVFAGYIPQNLYYLGRGIGRIAMPIFAYLIVEGFFYTHSRKKQLLTLAIFAFLSEAPFDFAFNFLHETTRYAMQDQNVMLTFTIGYGMLMAVDLFKEKLMVSSPAKYNIYSVTVIMAASLAAVLTKCDYTYFGILILLTFYYFRFHKAKIAAAYIVCLILFLNYYEIPSLIALLFIFMHNGRQWPRRMSEHFESDRDTAIKYRYKSYYVIKYAFYAFYPVHLLILAFIRDVIVA
jgi:hypothetical protein